MYYRCHYNIGSNNGSSMQVYVETPIVLPFKFTRDTMYFVLDQALEKDLSAKSKNILLDFKRLEFVDPTGITVLSNLIEFLKKQGVHVTYQNYKRATRGNKFLDDSGFFKEYIGEDPIFLGSTLRKSTLPLELIRQDKSYSWIFNRFIPWIAPKVKLHPDSFGSIAVCLMEVFNNIGDHSGENCGCAFAQHYPQKDSVVLTISDFGKGIPTNVRTSLPQLDDAEAIEQATVEGFTTKSHQRNQGAGLAILVKNVVQNNQGEMWISSLSGSVRCINSASGVRNFLKTSKISYPGTMLEMTFRTDLLEPITRKEEFEW